MNAKSTLPWFHAGVMLVLIALFPVRADAQCYLNQGCRPVDNLTYTPNGTGQVYHGDGASNNGSGNWTTNYSDVNQCLSCHYGTDTMPYLQTAHKNTLRKMAPGALWAGPDLALYSPTDDYYGSGSGYDWTNGLITSRLVRSARNAGAEWTSRHRSGMQVSVLHPTQCTRAGPVHTCPADPTSWRRSQSFLYLCRMDELRRQHQPGCDSSEYGFR